MVEPEDRVDTVCGAPTGPRGRPVSFTWDGRTVRGYQGDTVASALHASGERALMRSIKYHRPRGYFCGVGRCAGCLVRIDGVPNQRACLVQAKPGLRVESQNALPNARVDVLSIVDKWYRESFDYHDKFVRPAFMKPVFHKVVRHMAGFGELPDTPAMQPRRPGIARMTVDVAIVGGGAAGLAAARAAREEGARVAVVEEHVRAGGTLRFTTTSLGKVSGDATGPAFADATLEGLRAHGDEARVMEDATAIGLYRGIPRREPHEAVDAETLRAGSLGDLVILTPERLEIARPRALVVAAGANEVPPLFPGNDLPGIMGGRAAQRLLFEHGVRPGRDVLVVGANGLAQDIGTQLEDAGCGVRRVEADTDVKRAHGATRVKAVTLASGERVTCDAVVTAAAAAPRLELLQQADAEIAWDAKRGGWVPRITGRAGETTTRGVYAAGSCTGVRPAAESAADGDRAGRAAARFALAETKGEHA